MRVSEMWGNQQADSVADTTQAYLFICTSDGLMKEKRLENAHTSLWQIETSPLIPQKGQTPLDLVSSCPLSLPDCVRDLIRVFPQTPILGAQSPHTKGWVPASIPVPPGSSGTRFPGQLNIAVSCVSHRPSYLPGHLNHHSHSKPDLSNPCAGEASSHPVSAAGPLSHTLQHAFMCSWIVPFSTWSTANSREAGAAAVWAQRWRTSLTLWDVTRLLKQSLTATAVSPPHF